jgi:hypothetical protein
MTRSITREQVNDEGKVIVGKWSFGTVDGIGHIICRREDLPAVQSAYVRRCVLEGIIAAGGEHVVIDGESELNEVEQQGAEALGMTIEEVMAGISDMNKKLPKIIRGHHVIGIHLCVDPGSLSLVGNLRKSVEELMRDADAKDAGLPWGPDQVIASIAVSDLPAIFAGELEPQWSFDDEV